ncbi:MAG: FHA domain-containing protein, partial [Polyangiales bacterium]
MPPRSPLLIGSAPGSDLLLRAPGVAPQHARLYWQDGLCVQDLGQGVTTVDGRRLAPQEAAQLAGVHARLTVGEAVVPLNTLEVARLYCERTALPMSRPGVLAIGRDPARAHVLVSHPTVSGLHAQVDLNAGTFTDQQSKSGSFDRASQRLPPGQPVQLDTAGGYALGGVYVPTAILFELAGAQAPASQPMMGHVMPTNQGGPQSHPGPVMPQSGPAPFGSNQGGYASNQGAPQAGPQGGQHKTMFG